MVWSPSFDVTKRWQTFFIAGERVNQEFDGSLPVISIKKLKFYVVLFKHIHYTNSNVRESYVRGTVGYL
jgi:hypothetical protein